MLVIGTLLAVGLTIVGLAATYALASLERQGAVPAHVIQDTLQAWGINATALSLGATGLVVYGAFFVATWVVIVRGAHVAWRNLGFRRVHVRALAVVILVYLVVLVLSALVTDAESTLFLHGQLNNPQDAIFTDDTQHTIGQIIIYVAVISIVGPIVEELLFRGLLYRLLRRSLPLWAAVAISSFVFALAHGYPILIPPLFVYGVALALVFEYTHSLYGSFSLHFLINTVAVVAGLSAH